MAKDITFSDILTKLSHVYNKDLYIVDYKLCIAGPETDENLKSDIVCILGPLYMNIIKAEYPDSNIIFISDIKKSKTDKTLISTKVFETTKREVTKKSNDLYNISQEISEWETFNLPQSAVESLFTYGRSYTMFSQGPYPKMIISQDLFPMMSEKNYNMLRYHVLDKTDNDVYTFVSMFDVEHMQIENIIRYISLD